jgi:hypothetical protein
MLNAFNKLVALTRAGNRFSAQLKKSISDRLLDTADLGQLILGYLITPTGLFWYRNLPIRTEHAPPWGSHSDGLDPDDDAL